MILILLIRKFVESDVFLSYNYHIQNISLSIIYMYSTY